MPTAETEMENVFSCDLSICNGNVLFS